MQRKSDRTLVNLPFCILGLLLIIGSSCSSRREDAPSVAKEFAHALMENDVDKAKELAHVDQWRNIDDWAANHVSFECPGREWESGTGSVGSRDIKSDTWNIAVQHQCVDEGSVHCFKIHNVTVKPTANGFQVIAWEFECEVNDFCYACLSP